MIPPLSVRAIVSLATLLIMCTACAADEGEQYSYCDVEPIIAAKCLRCHSDPVQNHAPFPLTTYEAVFTERRGIFEQVKLGNMPLTKLSLEPPVEELTETEYHILLDWIEQGAIDCE